MWIKWAEQEPPKNCGILISTGSSITVAEYRGMIGGTIEGYPSYPHFSGHNWSGYDWEWSFFEGEVTHWAPLPDPPFEEK